MSLTFSDYQQGTTHTRIYRDKIRDILDGLGLPPEDFAARRVATLLGVAYAGLGMGEVGEVQGKIKKVIRDSGGVITDEVKATVAGELGDCLWYLAAMAEELGLDLGQVAQANLDKLADRKARGVIQGSGDKR